MKKHECPISAQLVIPASFAECLTYEKQILWLYQCIEALAENVNPEEIVQLKADVDELKLAVSILNSEVDAVPTD